MMVISFHLLIKIDNNEIYEIIKIEFKSKY